ncbi:MAG: hypothetical protein NC123_15375 [Butyrivibrio sp.]|nr:hypothetical protein [Acetatifactor muris]MCM1560901.1 hypothetical protein [Butyrivibrio sp.]
MTLQEMKKRYPDSYIVLSPRIREVETRKPLTFRVLVALFSAKEAMAAEGQYIRDGVADVCILSTYDEAGGLPPEEVARFFRVLYGMTGVSSTETIRFVMLPYQTGGGEDGGQ